MFNCGSRTPIPGVVCLLVATLLLAAPGFSQNRGTTAPIDLDDLVQRAESIVRGRIISAKIESHPQFPNLRTALITLSVTKTLKGATAPTLTFRQFYWGPAEDSTFAKFKGAGEVLFFLNPVSQYGLTSPVGLEQGYFRVIRDAKGNSYVVNGRGNYLLFDHIKGKASARGISFSTAVQRMLADPKNATSLERFEEAVQTLAGVPR
jgi:hypothetical protein